MTARGVAPRRSPLAVVALIAALAAGCGGFGGGPASNPNGIGIANGTSVPVAVEVNGQWIGTYPAWTDVTGIDVRRGAPPWRVMILTPEDEPIASITVEPGKPTSARWITSCGTLVAWFMVRPLDAPTVIPGAEPPGPPCT